MGHSRFGKKNKFTTDQVLITIDRELEEGATIEEIVDFLIDCGSFGYVETDLGTTSIIIKCTNRDELVTALKERWSDVEYEVDDAKWVGKERECPKCNSRFSSIEDRGQCPNCSYIFYASHPVDWDGKDRECPKCNSRFSSIKDRGQCPNCSYIFDASNPVDLNANETKIEECESWQLKMKSWLKKKTTVKKAERGSFFTRVLLGIDPGLVNDEEWQKLKDIIIEGDELWTFKSPPETWRQRRGREGIALVRDGKIVKDILTAMN